MNRKPGFLIDLDGTLFRGSRKIPHAGEFVRFLQEHQLPYLFVTNNSTRTPEAVAEHLGAMGVPAEADRVLTTAQAAAQYVRTLEHGRGRKPRVFLVGEAGLFRAFDEEAFELAAGEAADALSADDAADYVVQGKDKSMTYHRLTRAANLIHNGARYILTNPDLILPAEQGFILGAGSISAMLVAATQRPPVVIGKPSKIIMDIALARLGLDAQDTYVVGDNPMTDIAAGRAAGCRTALVLTGLATRDNLEQLTAEEDRRPDGVYPTLAELQQELLRSL